MVIVHRRPCILWYCASSNSNQEMPELSGGSINLKERLIICVGEGLDTVECGPGQVCL